MENASDERSGRCVRKQYHFRRNEQRGLLAWDVARLLELSRDLPSFELPLREVQELDEPYWFSDGESSPTCRVLVEHMALVEHADLSFPIVLSADGRVMDGMHRVAKALLAGLDGVRAVRFETDPEPDYFDCRPSDLPY
jgi:hypothetical protein